MLLGDPQILLFLICSISILASNLLDEYKPVTRHPPFHTFASSFLVCFSPICGNYVNKYALNWFVAHTTSNYRLKEHQLGPTGRPRIPRSYVAQPIVN